MNGRLIVTIIKYGGRCCRIALSVLYLNCNCYLNFIKIIGKCFCSCSGKGNLNFNCLLMLFPDEVIDYVVIHELCHRKHMNHSAEFYSEVERVCPEYRKCRNWLKEHGGVHLRRLP